MSFKVIKPIKIRASEIKYQFDSRLSGKTDNDHVDELRQSLDDGKTLRNPIITRDHVEVDGRHGIQARIAKSVRDTGNADPIIEVDVIDFDYSKADADARLELRLWADKQNATPGTPRKYSSFEDQLAGVKEALLHDWTPAKIKLNMPHVSKTRLTTLLQQARNSVNQMKLHQARELARESAKEGKAVDIQEIIKQTGLPPKMSGSIVGGVGHNPKTKQPFALSKKQGTLVRRATTSLSKFANDNLQRYRDFQEGRKGLDKGGLLRLTADNHALIEKLYRDSQQVVTRVLALTGETELPTKKRGRPRKDAVTA